MKRIKEARIKYPNEGEESPTLIVFGFDEKNRPTISEVKLDEIGTSNDRKVLYNILLEALQNG